ncbi:alpha/beta hydrolase [Paenibacillus sp. TRM 82003]|nr:alpha/beta hydrolase [Paenibacillus sp. TRM 82003]
MLAVAVLLLITYYFSNQVLGIRTHPNEAILMHELNQGRISREQFELLPKEQVVIDSPYGYKLNAWFVPSAEGIASRTVVFAHGVTSSLLGMLKYTDMFRRRGFNVLLYDHRRHGLSGGRFTTYGYYERYDLKAAVDWVCARFGADTTVGVFGESMGAATTLLYAAIDDRPAFVVADCPYSDLAEQMAYRLKVQYRLPKFPLLMITSLWCKLRAGFYFHEVSPIEEIDRVKAPVLFIHGQKDAYVPNRMTEAMHARRKGAKELYLAPNAAHAEAWAKNREEYERMLDSFLRLHRVVPDAVRA